MKISKPQIKKQGDKIICRFNVSAKAYTKDLWYELDSNYADLISSSSDSALLALLLPAMLMGEDIYLEGQISTRLYYNLLQTVQKIIQIQVPFLESIKIFPSGLTAETKRAKGVITGFSGGVDSYCALADHHYSEVPVGYQITHLFFNNVGSNGPGEIGEKLWRERYAYLKDVTKKIKLPFLMINSNLDSFYPSKLDFMQTATYRNMSVALLLQNGIGRYLCASSDNYSDIFVGPTLAMNEADPIVLPLLSTEIMDALATGHEYSRVEKLLKVSKIKDSHHTLNVCISGESAENCSKCRKCMLTILTLEIMGNMDLYLKTFNYKVYKKHRGKFIRLLLNDPLPLLKEVVSFAKTKDFRFSYPSYLSAKWDRLLRKIKAPSINY